MRRSGAAQVGPEERERDREVRERYEKGNGRKQRRGTRGSCWKWSPVELGEHLLGRETGSAWRGRAALQVLDASREAGEAAAEVDRGGVLVGFAAETRKRRWWLAVIGWRRKSRELVGAIRLAGIWIGRDPEGDMRGVVAAAGMGMAELVARV